MIFLIFLTSLNLYAKTFETSYLKLDLPDSWACQQKEKNWICRSQNPKEAKEGFIALRAKLSGDSDNLQQYLLALQQPQILTRSTKKIIRSKVYSAEIKKFNNHQWVKSLHLGSLLPRYFTYYFLSTKGDLSLSFELNFHQSLYNKYDALAQQIAASLIIKPSVPSSAFRVALPATSPSFPGNIDLQTTNEELLDAPGLNRQFTIILAAGLLILFGLGLYWTKI